VPGRHGRAHVRTLILATVTREAVAAALENLALGIM
jgi:hypothetical protein